MSKQGASTSSRGLTGPPAGYGGGLRCYCCCPGSTPLPPKQNKKPERWTIRTHTAGQTTKESHELLTSAGRYRCRPRALQNQAAPWRRDHPEFLDRPPVVVEVHRISSRAAELAQSHFAFTVGSRQGILPTTNGRRFGGRQWKGGARSWSRIVPDRTWLPCNSDLGAL